LVDGEAGKLNAILVGLIVLIVSGCALPVPLSYLSYGRMAYDANQIIQGDATTTDVALSLTTGMDCQILNVLEDKDICARKVEKNELSYHDADNHSDSLCLGLQ
jgi:hypothetical protein